MEELKRQKLNHQPLSVVGFSPTHLPHASILTTSAPLLQEGNRAPAGALTPHREDKPAGALFIPKAAGGKPGLGFRLAQSSSRPVWRPGPCFAGTHCLCVVIGVPAALPENSGGAGLIIILVLAGLYLLFAIYQLVTQFTKKTKEDEKGKKDANS